MTRNDHNHRPHGDRAMERLVQQDRIVEARMLPKNRKLRKHEIENVRAKLRQLMEGGEVTIARVASETSYQSSTLSQWLSDTYKGRVDLVTQTVNAWIERHTRRQSSNRTRAYISTWVCDQMISTIRHAHRRERMAAITAPSGSGKDMVIELVAEELNGYVIRCHSKMTANVLIHTIAAKTGITLRRYTCAQILDKVVEELRDKTVTLILNEAQSLPSECAGIIRTIYDETHVPIIMLGAADIFGFIDDRESGDGQFWRRTIKLNILERLAREPNPDDPSKLGRPLYTLDEIRDFIRMKQLRLTDDATQMLWKIACQFRRGTLGLANELIEGVADLWGESEEITVDLICSQLFMESGDESDVILAEADHWHDQLMTKGAA